MWSCGLWEEGVVMWVVGGGCDYVSCGRSCGHAISASWEGLWMY